MIVSRDCLVALGRYLLPSQSTFNFRSLRQGHRSSLNVLNQLLALRYLAHISRRQVALPIVTPAIIAVFKIVVRIHK